MDLSRGGGAVSDISDALERMKLEHRHHAGDDDSVGGASEGVATPLGSPDAFCNEDGQVVYGRLVVLGYKEYLVKDSVWNPTGQCNEIFDLRRREDANGIERAGSYFLHGASKRSKAQLPPLRYAEATHSVTMNVDLSEEDSHASDLLVVEDFQEDEDDDLGEAEGFHDAGARGAGAVGDGRVGMIGESQAYTPRSAYEAPSMRLGPDSATPPRLSRMRAKDPARPSPYDAHLGGQPATHLRVEYAPHNGTDMFQIGRMATEENDIVIRGPLHRDRSNILCGPVSRFACRILCSRTWPYKATIYAAGFNSEKEIFLSDSAPKICSRRSHIDDFDALTTFGVRVWLPDVQEWREVSVHGHQHLLRPGLSSPGDAVTRGPKGAKESCELADGAIIDIAGIQLLWRTGPILNMLSSNLRMNRIVEGISARRPQCPVQYHTINFKYCVSTEEEKQNLDEERRPFIFPACGHAHSYNKAMKGLPCPMCRTLGPYVELKFSWVPSISNEEPVAVFNPCGHMTDLATAEKWSNIKLPDNAPPNAKYRPICPYCAKALKRTPYSRILWDWENAPGVAYSQEDDGAARS